jgi:putative membrane protein
MNVSALVAAGVLCLGTGTVSAQTLTDSQIAAIAVTANQVDIDAGKLAESKATHPDVRKFGQQMVADHTSVNERATALASRLNVTSEDNQTSQSLKTGGAKSLEELKALDGPAFDKAYIDHEMAYHQSVIEEIDKTLISGAQNAELKPLLVKVRPTFVAHLEQARMIQASPGK